MEEGKGLGFVGIGVLMLLFCGVAEAGNPCYEQCNTECSEETFWYPPFRCSLSPACLEVCAIKCSLHDTCKHGGRKRLLPNTAKVVATVGIEVGNPCYAECVQDCFNNCGLSPFGCAACPGICGTHNTCKNIKNVEINSSEDVSKSYAGFEARNNLRLNSVADE